MVYCADGSQQWTLCDDEPSGSDTPIPWPGCFCPNDESSRILAFSSPGDIPGEIQLPLSSGGVMSFYEGYSPNTVPTSTTSSTSATTSGSSSTSTSTTSEVSSVSTTAGSHPVTSFANANPQATQHHGDGLSKGAKIGIGIGASLGGSAAVVIIAAMALYIRRLKRRQLGVDSDPRNSHSGPPAAERDDINGSGRAVPSAPSGNPSELAGNESESRDLSSIISPESTLRTWSRPMSTEMEGTIPKHLSMTSLHSQELGTDSPISKEPIQSARVLPVGIHRPPGSSTVPQASYRPGRQVGDGVYEMPAHLPGSTFLE
jgi:hypothetical protein